MNNILNEIVENKKLELIETKKNQPINILYEQIKNNIQPIKNFKSALQKHSTNIIAEIKKASPSKGNIVENPDKFDIVKLAKIYEEAGASAISVLTEQKYFKGLLADLTTISKAVKIPVLRKEFIIDPYQIFEARFCGADAILLIAAILDDSTLTEFLSTAKTLGMDVLVEVHTKEELERVLKTNADIIGINNRNLENFEVDINTTKKLIESIDKKLIKSKNLVFVSESGIFNREHINALQKYNVNAFLIGEALITSQNPQKKIKELLGF